MKTVINQALELLDKEIKFITVNDSQEDKYYQAGLKHAYNLLKDNLSSEKNQVLSFHVECVKQGTIKENEIEFSEEDRDLVNKQALIFYDEYFV